VATIQAVRGMNDILPDESEAWLDFEAKVGAWLERYGYRNIRMPLVEHSQLFRRAIGEATDIVEKEMYSWRDPLNDEELTLRPEGTASCVRAAIEHSLLHDGPKRLWYAGPMFRHERPQKGRYRQFHQYGVEALGFPGPDVDAELIAMCAALWRDLGLQGLRLELNTIGAPEERSRYRTDLIKFLEKNISHLDEDARRRLHTNPLRTLDSKNPMVQEVVAKAPALSSYLGAASAAHFEGLERLLGAAGLSYKINPKLVRGLDYYNLTVFEWISDSLGAQGTVCGGGRYDGLFELIGGKPAPAAGFAMGNERLLALIGNAQPSMENAQIQAGRRVPHAYVMHQGDGAPERAFALAEELRSKSYRILLHAGGGSFKSQMKKADASGALFGVIIGEDELRANEVTFKFLRQEAQQVRVKRDGIAEFLAGALKGKA
jgi:histidyl-tRNA synthetase